MDDEEQVDIVEWVCEHCAGVGCAHCDPDHCSCCQGLGCAHCDPGWAQVYPLAAALDCILTGTPFGGGDAA